MFDFHAGYAHTRAHACPHLHQLSPPLTACAHPGQPWYDAAFVSEMILMSRYFSTAIEFQRLLVERAVAALADLGGVGFEAFEADVGARTMERRAVVIRMIKVRRSRRVARRL